MLSDGWWNYYADPFCALHWTEQLEWWGYSWHFLISNVSWVLANIMTESSPCFQEWNRNSERNTGCRLQILYNGFCTDFGLLITTYFIYTHQQELMKSVGCYGRFMVTAIWWWSWWSDTLWPTVIKFFRTALNVMVSFRSFVVEISLQIFIQLCCLGCEPLWCLMNFLFFELWLILGFVFLPWWNFFYLN